MSFTWFPRLPAELRLKIWELALPGPRIITLYTPPDHNIDRTTNYTAYSNDHTLKALYHTCKASHDTVVKFYKRQTQLLGQFSRLPIWFNNEIDTICLAERAVGKMVKQMVIEPDWGSSWYENQLDLLINTKSLLISTPFECLPSLHYHDYPMAKFLAMIICHVVTNFKNVERVSFVLGARYKFDIEEVSELFRKRGQKRGNWLYLEGYGKKKIVDELKFELVRLTEVPDLGFAGFWLDLERMGENSLD